MLFVTGGERQRALRTPLFDVSRVDRRLSGGRAAAEVAALLLRRYLPSQITAASVSRCHSEVRGKSLQVTLELKKGTADGRQMGSAVGRRFCIIRAQNPRQEVRTAGFPSVDINLHRGGGAGGVCVECSGAVNQLLCVV